MMTTLEVVRAGAGSGKTTDLCRTVAEAVAAGLDPARILATTFTKKAAAELKGRIQAKLLEDYADAATRHRVADRLDLAAIGTVHSVAHQILSRYAIPLGLSPRLEVVAEAASERALRDILGATPVATWQPLADCAGRLAINDLHPRILGLLAAKRGNRLSDKDFAAQMAASANRVCELLAPTGPAATATPTTHLADLIDQALTNINALTDTTQVTKDAKQKLRLLKSGRLPLWASYVEAMRIAAGKKSGADRMLDALRNHAAQVSRNPGLHSDIREFATLIAAETIRLEAEYRRYKAERGLVDFTDLEILFLGLLQDEPLCAQLAADFDLVLVDEFQDTNPLQLAIFQRLRSLTPRSRWVGDPKQAIYGFRDTDPELVNNIWKTAPGATRTELPDNYRSQRGLVQLVGTLFEPVFGVDARQNPKKKRKDRGVERWLLQTKNQKDDALALACGIAALHADGIRFGDMVVLERTNRLLNPLADAFASLGIPYLLESPGLLRTCEAALVMAGLRLVLDRSDSLAAATAAHFLGDATQETPDWLTERLEALRAAADAGDGTRTVPWAGDPRFAPIEGIAGTLASPTQVVQQVIDECELPSLVQRWGDAGRRCSNLDSLLRHAREYEEAAVDAGQAATLSGLIVHLEQLADENKDLRYPPQGHDAVTLMTYHSAKGLEWPVVILSGLNSDRDPNMWSPVVLGGGVGDDPLQGRAVRSWTWPFGVTEGDFPKLRTGSGLENDALTSPEGQERAAREATENLRLLYVGCTRAKDKLVFAHRDGKYQWLAQLPTIDTILDCGLDDGEHALDGIDTTFVVCRLDSTMADACRVPTPAQECWVHLPKQASVDRTDRFHSPSAASAEGTDAVLRTVQLPGTAQFPSGAKEDQYAPIGDAVHAYMASLPSTRSLSDRERECIAERCLAAFAVTGLLDPAVLVSAGERFCEWVQETFPGARWHTEVAMTAPRAAGGQWLGTGDLILDLPEGDCVIVDHKSAPIRREHCAAKAATFAGQLAGYAETAATAGSKVRAAFIHFPLAGVVAEMRAG
jgi:superfamily I DNA/RNA helicase